MSLQTIRDVATRDVVTATPDTNARTLAEMMREENVGSVVIQESGHPIGIVTDRDLTVRILANGDDGTETFAREMMTGRPATIKDDVGVYEAARKMDQQNVRRMPVVGGADMLVGIVTLDDIYREIVTEQGHLAAVIAAESPES